MSEHGQSRIVLGRVSASRSWCAVPESFRNEQEEEYTAKSADHRDNPISD